MVMLQQMIVMFLLMITGYVCFKKKIITHESSKKLSALVVNVANPCLVLGSALGDNQIQGKELLQTFLLVLVMYTLLLIVAQFLPKLLRVGKKSRGTYGAMTVFTNLGFMGFPVVSAMYGSGALLYAAVFMIPFNVLIYTYGVGALSVKECGGDDVEYGTRLTGVSESKEKISGREQCGEASLNDECRRKIDGEEGEKKASSGKAMETVKKIFNIGVIACIVALLLYFIKPPVPSFLTSTITHLGNLTAPLSMMVIGASLAELSLRDLFLDYRLLLFSLIKLLIIPACWMLFVNHFVEQEILRGVCFVMMATPAASMTAMLAQQYDGDYETASKGVALTTLLSVITMPILAAVFL